MIVTDNSFVPMPGKEAEAIAVFKEIVARFNQRWPLTAPRQILVDLTGEMGRVHLIATKESMAEHERQQSEQLADETVQTLFTRISPLGVPGSLRGELRRVV
jgi:hypothetical protein